jgi:hypothetical protein
MDVLVRDERGLREVPTTQVFALEKPAPSVYTVLVHRLCKQMTIVFERPGESGRRHRRQIGWARTVTVGNNNGGLSWL